MANIHATAVVDPNADLGADVAIGPFCVVGPQVKLGRGVVLHSHVAVVGRTTISRKTRNITASKAASTSDRTPSSAST
jgi:UDP-N-acetylglucosamine acyltransferase